MVVNTHLCRPCHSRYLKKTSLEKTASTHCCRSPLIAFPFIYYPGIPDHNKPLLHHLHLLYLTTLLLFLVGGRLVVIVLFASISPLSARVQRPCALGLPASLSSTTHGCPRLDTLCTCSRLLPTVSSLPHALSHTLLHTLIVARQLSHYTSHMHILYTLLADVSHARRRLHASAAAGQSVLTPHCYRSPFPSWPFGFASAPLPLTNYSRACPSIVLHIVPFPHYFALS